MARTRNFGLMILTLTLAQGIRAQTMPLRLVATLPMPAVSGRVDHLSVDLEHRRLFVSALGNDTIEVFNLRQQKLIRTLRGFREPQGVLYSPKSGRLFVANGGDGTLRLFDGTTFRWIKKLNFGSDADDLRYDATTGDVYLAYGEGDIAELDGATGKVLGRIRVDAHPEAFVLDGDRIYVNVPTADEIETLDWKQKRPIARWRLGRDRWNFPMAMDRANHRLFVVCRDPAELLVLDATSGAIMARLPVVPDADDIYFDRVRKRLYISGGGGEISVVEQLSTDRYRLLANIPTAPGARTSLYVPSLNRLYLAVPRHASHPAEIRVFQAQ